MYINLFTRIISCNSLVTRKPRYDIRLYQPNSVPPALLHAVIRLHRCLPMTSMRDINAEIRRNDNNASNRTCCQCLYWLPLPDRCSWCSVITDIISHYLHQIRRSLYCMLYDSRFKRLATLHHACTHRCTAVRYLYINCRSAIVAVQMPELSCTDYANLGSWIRSTRIWRGWTIYK